jgi:2-oxoglutarate ferredoxin oxidoreductase subunit alpha
LSRRAAYLGRLQGRTAFVMGDEACAMGALFAGCDFFGGYPITPASEVAEVMARELPRVGGRYVQLEDELASISAVMGAAWSGGRAMTATSGPGFSLMQETIGYAVMTETPCVVVDVQRSGPSTGQATKPAQGDLMQARWGTHGDHEIIALSPWSVQECFDLTLDAFGLSERFRTPVIVLMDGAIGHIREPLAYPAFSEKRLPRRPLAAQGQPAFGGRQVPPMALIGDGHNVHVTGSTHRPDGIREVSSSTVHQQLVSRLVDKIASAREELTRLDTRWMDGARTAVVAFGSTARPALGAVERARAQGLEVGLVRPVSVWPFPGPALGRRLSGVQRVLVPEMNLGQMCRELERFVRCPLQPLPKIGGVMHTVDEIYEALVNDGA